MTMFAYEATGKDGARKKGRIEAASPAAAARKIREEMGLRPKYVKVDVAPVGKKVSPIDLEDAMDSMADMLEAGVDMLSTLASLRESHSGMALGRIFAEMCLDVESSLTVSQAMSRHPKVFSKLGIGIVASGEESGKLPQAIFLYVDMMRFNRETASEIKSAMVYPAFALATILGSLIVFNLFVIPAIAQMFSQFKAELPWITQMLLSFSKVFKAAAPYLLVGGGLAVWLTKRWYGTDAGRERIDGMLLRMPIFGELFVKSAMSRFCGALAGGLASGVRIDRAITMAVGATGNAAAERRLEKINARLAEGKPFDAAAASSGMFKDATMAIVASAEKTGRLDAAMDKVSKQFLKEVRKKIKALPNIINPILILIIGGLFLVMALGMYLPLFSMGTIIK